MALSAKMLLRQGQSLVMTPQLLQAIKLLQYSSAELSAFVEEELERNPLLERAEDIPDPPSTGIDALAEAQNMAAQSEFSSGDPQESDWSSDQLSVSGQTLAESLGTDVDNAFDAERELSPAAEQGKLELLGLSDVAWSGASGSGSSGEPGNIEAYIAEETTLTDHLARQLAIATADPVQRMIGMAIIDALDDAGYLREAVEDIAIRLGGAVATVEKALELVQSFEPSGIAARNLSECLALQLRELDRYDPCMQSMVENLHLVAKRDLAALRRVCGVDDDDISDMIAEIRRLDPKPGRAFGSTTSAIVVPDVIVRAARDGSWFIELNADALPRVLVNQTYAARVSRSNSGDDDRNFIVQCLQTANWLTKSLEQRARTILKVAAENRASAGRLFLSRGRIFVSAEFKNHCRRRWIARIHSFPRYLEQVHVYASRHVRAEIFFYRLDCRPWRRRRLFCGSSSVQNQTDDRWRGAHLRAFGRRHR